MSSVVISGDVSGSVTLQAPSAAGTTTLTLPAGSGTVLTTNASSITPEANGGTGTTTGYYGFKNRIINGAMVIDQRNAGASVSVTSGGQFYSVDRFWGAGITSSQFNLQQDSNVPSSAGFIYSLKATVITNITPSSTSQARIAQSVEGLNVADLMWGTANAKTVTLSFWVRSSLTGTFSGSLMNSASDRSYPYTYTISSANTWEYKTVTIAGDTTGTWLNTNGVGINVEWSLGAGSSRSGTANTWQAGRYHAATGAVAPITTSGATFYITGVQLEVGSTATSFDYRPYGTELALCQRYYAKSYAQGTVPGTSTTVGLSGASSGAGGTYTDLLTVYLPVTMRTTASVSFWDTVGNASKITRLIANTPTTNQTGSPSYETDSHFTMYGSSGVANANGLYVHWAASAEL